MEHLEKFRREIDEIDEKIIKLFERRINIVLEIADYKKSNNIEVYQQDREKQVVKNALAALENDKFSDETVELLNFIMGLSKDIQKKRLEDNKK